VPDDALDSRTRLTLIVQDQGLCMEDPPSIPDDSTAAHIGNYRHLRISRGKFELHCGERIGAPRQLADKLLAE
jgi:hypothetical protein